MKLTTRAWEPGDPGGKLGRGFFMNALQGCHSEFRGRLRTLLVPSDPFQGANALGTKNRVRKEPAVMSVPPSPTRPAPSPFPHLLLVLVGGGAFI